MRRVRALVAEYGDSVASKMLDEAMRYNGHENKNESSSGGGGAGGLFIIDKMLFNYNNVGFIHLVYPNALILHTVRDPMDTLLSCYSHKFDDEGLEWVLDGDSLALQYSLYLQLMQHWRTVLPGRVVDVRMDELVNDPRAVLSRLLDSLGLPWDEAVLKFHEKKRVVHTHSRAQVRLNVQHNCVCLCPSD